MHVTATRAGGKERWTDWAASVERRKRLEALVHYKEMVMSNNIPDMAEEVASATRLYREIMGPTRVLDKEDILVKYRRGWCWLQKEMEQTQMEMTLWSLRNGLNKSKYLWRKYQDQAICRLGLPQFL